MLMNEYKCQQCKEKFYEPELSCSEEQVEVKCPQCRSMNVRKSEVSGGILELLGKIMPTGGG